MIEIGNQTTVLSRRDRRKRLSLISNRDDLDAFTRGLEGLDGQFTQTVFDAHGKLKETTSGRVALSAPRLFRWEYVKPYEQLVIADGSKVWVYDPDLSQVTVRPQGEQEQNSPLATLIDPSRLDRDYQVAETGAEDGLEWLELTPKQAANASFSANNVTPTNNAGGDQGKNKLGGDVSDAGGGGDTGQGDIENQSHDAVLDKSCI